MRQAIVLAVLLLVVLVAYTVVPKPASGPVTAADVQRFVLEDAQKAYGPEASYEPLRTQQTGASWAIDVKIALAPHSVCPKLIKREYTFPPVYFREEVWNDRCEAGSLIVYPEEALMASSKLNKVVQLGSRAYGTATLYSAAQLVQIAKCTSCTALESFAKSIPAQETWIVEWKNGVGAFYVAVDAAGNIVANS